MEAIRALKRRLSDLVSRQLVNDQKRLRRRAERRTGEDKRGGCWLQRGRLQPQCRRFGEVPARRRRLRQPQLTIPTILRPVPDALDRRRPAADVKRSRLDTGEDRRSIARRNGPVDTEACHGSEPHQMPDPLRQGQVSRRQSVPRPACLLPKVSIVASPCRPSLLVPVLCVTSTVSAKRDQGSARGV